MRGQHHGDGRVAMVLLAMALEREADRVRVRYITFHRLEDGGLQCRRFVTFEQTQQRGGDDTKVGAAFGGAREQRLAGRHRPRQAIPGSSPRTAAMLARRVFFVGQRPDMGGIFDLRALVVAALVTREQVATAWTGAVFGVILTPHACPARCEGTAPSGTAGLGPAPCLFFVTDSLLPCDPPCRQAVRRTRRSIKAPKRRSNPGGACCAVNVRNRRLDAGSDSYRQPIMLPR